MTAPRLIEPDHTLVELDFGSLTALSLRDWPSAITTLDLPAPAVLDHPTPSLLARYLCRRLVASGGVLWPTDASVLLVRGANSTVTARRNGITSEGGLPDEVVDLPGDYLPTLEKHAASMATAVNSGWLPEPAGASTAASRIGPQPLGTSRQLQKRRVERTEL